MGKRPRVRPKKTWEERIVEDTRKLAVGGERKLTEMSGWGRKLNEARTRLSAVCLKEKCLISLCNLRVSSLIT